MPETVSGRVGVPIDAHTEQWFKDTLQSLDVRAVALEQALGRVECAVAELADRFGAMCEADARAEAIFRRAMSPAPVRAPRRLRAVRAQDRSAG